MGYIYDLSAYVVYSNGFYDNIILLYHLQYVLKEVLFTLKKNLFGETLRPKDLTSWCEFYLEFYALFEGGNSVHIYPLPVSYSPRQHCSRPRLLR